MTPPDEFDHLDVQPVVRQRRRQGAADGGAPVEDASRAANRQVPTEPGRAGPQRQRPQDQEPQRQRPGSQEPQRSRAQNAQRPQGRRPDPRRTTADDDYVVLPPPTSGARRLFAVGGAAVMVLAILIGGLLLWASRQVDPSGEPGELVASVVVPSGSSTEAIAELLAQEGVISDARMFRYYVGWKGAGPWDAGEYVDFRTDSSFDEAIEVLDSGPVQAQARVIRIIEGRRLSDALVQISEQLPALTVEVLQDTLDSGAVTSAYKPPEVASWEGLLFPDTYEFDEAVTAQEVLQAMATKMEDVLDGLGYDKAETLQGRTAYELVTIASLIEKETGAPAEERGMISRVISNRLDDDETLGIDASVLYGLGRDAGELTRSDLDTETPYNTRIITGLPPTPIALPGEASLAAAIEPSDGDWRYYVLVSNDPPQHFFTDDYDEFLEAKSDAQADGVF